MKTIDYRKFLKWGYEARDYGDFSSSVTLYKRTPDCDIPQLVFCWEQQVIVECTEEELDELSPDVRALVKKDSGSYFYAVATDRGLAPEKQYATLMNFRRYGWAISTSCAEKGPAQHGYGYGATWPNRDDGFTVKCRSVDEVIKITLALTVRDLSDHCKVPGDLVSSKAAREGIEFLLNDALESPSARKQAAHAVCADNASYCKAELEVVE